MSASGKISPNLVSASVNASSSIGPGLEPRRMRSLTEPYDREERRPVPRRGDASCAEKGGELGEVPVKSLVLRGACKNSGDE